MAVGKQVDWIHPPTSPGSNSSVFISDHRFPSFSPQFLTLSSSSATLINPKSSLYRVGRHLHIDSVVPITTVGPSTSRNSVHIGTELMLNSPPQGLRHGQQQQQQQQQQKKLRRLLSESAI
jgi:hypothetical protein